MPWFCCAHVWRAIASAPISHSVHLSRWRSQSSAIDTHDAKVRAFRDALGFHKVNEKQRRWQGELECRIVKMRSASVGDLQIKFAIAEQSGCADKEDFESIALDVRKLMQRPALAQAFVEA